MKVFYHKDHDGECSAYIVKLAYAGSSADLNIEFIPMNYDIIFPVETVTKDETVYIVDFSIDPYDMERLLEITKSVYWIDHHVSAINKYRDTPYSIDGIREVGKAGCELTWQFLFPNDPVPNWVALIADRDVWRNALPQSMNFCCGLQIYDTSPESTDWSIIKDSVDDIAKQGDLICLYRNKIRESQVNRLAKLIEFEGYKCLILNTPERGSDIFEGWKGEIPDILIPYNFSDKLNGWNISFYSSGSKDVDLSKIAQKYGGGGHKGAAGTMGIASLPWKK